MADVLSQLIKTKHYINILLWHEEDTRLKYMSGPSERSRIRRFPSSASETWRDLIKWSKARYGIRSRGVHVERSCSLQQNNSCWRLNVWAVKRLTDERRQKPQISSEFHHSCVKDIPKSADCIARTGSGSELLRSHLHIRDSSTAAAKSKISSVTELYSARSYNHPWVWNTWRSYHRRIQRDDKLSSKKRSSIWGFNSCLSVQDICTIKALLPP